MTGEVTYHVRGECPWRRRPTHEVHLRSIANDLAESRAHVGILEIQLESHVCRVRNVIVMVFEFGFSEGRVRRRRVIHWTKVSVYKT